MSPLSDCICSEMHRNPSASLHYLIPCLSLIFVIMIATAVVSFAQSHERLFDDDPAEPWHITADEISFDKIRSQVQSLNEVEEFLTEPGRHSSQPSQPRSAPAKSFPKRLSTVSFIILSLALAALYFVYYE